MGGNMKDRWSVPVTAAANGSLIYIYGCQRPRYEGTCISMCSAIRGGYHHRVDCRRLKPHGIDVRRAISYWKKAGVLTVPGTGAAGPGGDPGPEASGLARAQDGGQASATTDFQQRRFLGKRGWAFRCPPG